MARVRTLYTVRRDVVLCAWGVSDARTLPLARRAVRASLTHPLNVRYQAQVADRVMTPMGAEQLLTSARK